MDITVSLPFLQFSSSGSSASLFAFILFCLSWIAVIFSFAGATAVLGRISGALK
jgi:hypothetical protein